MDKPLKFLILWGITLILLSLVDAVWHFLIIGRAYKEAFRFWP